MMNICVNRARWLGVAATLSIGSLAPNANAAPVYTGISDPSRRDMCDDDDTFCDPAVDPNWTSDGLRLVVIRSHDESVLLVQGDGP